MTLRRSIPLANALSPNPPSNDIDPTVAQALCDGYRRGDPIPAPTVYAVQHDKPGEWFRILLGQHRIEGARLAGMLELEVNVVEEPSTLDKLAIYFRENANRKTLGPLELAALFTRAMDAGSLNGKQVARQFGVSEATVSKSLQISRSLHDDLKKLVNALKLTPRSAYAISKLPLDKQVGFHAEHGVKTADEIEALVADELDKLGGAKAKAKPISAVCGSTRVVLPPDSDRALTDLKKLCAAIKMCSEKGGELKDVDVFIRMVGA